MGECILVYGRKLTPRILGRTSNFRMVDKIPPSAYTVVATLSLRAIRVKSSHSVQ